MCRMMQSTRVDYQEKGNNTRWYSTEVLYGEAPPQTPAPYPFEHQFGTSFACMLAHTIKKSPKKEVSNFHVVPNK